MFIECKGRVSQSAVVGETATRAKIGRSNASLCVRPCSNLLPSYEATVTVPGRSLFSLVVVAVACTLGHFSGCGSGSSSGSSCGSGSGSSSGRSATSRERRKSKSCANARSHLRLVQARKKRSKAARNNYFSPYSSSYLEHVPRSSKCRPSLCGRALKV